MKKLLTILTLASATLSHAASPTFGPGGAWGTPTITSGTLALTTTNTGTISGGAFVGDGSGLTDMIWSQIGSTPTTLSGYGITDAITVTSGTASVPTAGTAVTIVPSGPEANIDLLLKKKGLGNVRIGEHYITLGGSFSTFEEVEINGRITTAADFTTSGAFPLTLTTTASTNVTLPTSGTLATVSQVHNEVAAAVTSGTTTLSGAAGTQFTFTAAGATTVNISDMVAGQTGTAIVTQASGTSGYVLTFPAGTKQAYGGTNTITLSGTNTRDVIYFRATGTTPTYLIEGISPGYTP